MNHNGRISAEEAKLIVKKILDDHHKEMMSSIPQIIDDIDQSIIESSYKGSCILMITVSRKSPTWYHLETLKKEYEDRGFVFESFDTFDQPNMKIPDDGIYYNHITIKWNQNNEN